MQQYWNGKSMRMDPQLVQNAIHCAVWLKGTSSQMTHFSTHLVSTHVPTAWLTFQHSWYLHMLSLHDSLLNTFGIYTRAPSVTHYSTHLVPIHALTAWRLSRQPSTAYGHNNDNLDFFWFCTQQTTVFHKSILMNSSNQWTQTTTHSPNTYSVNKTFNMSI